MSHLAKRVFPTAQTGTAGHLKISFGALTQARATTAAVTMAMFTATDTASATG